MKAAETNGGKYSYRFFENRDCQFYPCHKGTGALNCLFCYCPLYGREVCPGTPRFLEKNGKTLKDCSACIFPHRPENYDRVIEWLRR